MLGQLTQPHSKRESVGALPVQVLLAPPDDCLICATGRREPGFLGFFEGFGRGEVCSSRHQLRSSGVLAGGWMSHVSSRVVKMDCWVCGLVVRLIGVMLYLKVGSWGFVRGRWESVFGSGEAG